MTQQQFAIVHVEGDCGNTTDGNTFDLFALIDAVTGIEKLSVQFEYSERGIDAKLIGAEPGATAMIAGCAGDMHFIASFMLSVLRAFTEDHDFYADAFYDAETGEDKPQPFTLAAI